MAKVRSTDTTPELAVRRIVSAMGYRYRLHFSGLPGKPDMVFRSVRGIIFVHGCFWHRHMGCKWTTTPKTRTAFWNSKFKKNVSRDKLVSAALRQENWRILVVWQCEALTEDTSKMRDKIRRFLSEQHKRVHGVRR